MRASVRNHDLLPKPHWRTTASARSCEYFSCFLRIVVRLESDVSVGLPSFFLLLFLSWYVRSALFRIALVFANPKSQRPTPDYPQITATAICWSQSVSGVQFSIISSTMSTINS
eukprot:m.533246 g.533246  ORF g.533246 m.533246 type:complete len:114 (+) comp57598_c1_seq30:3080-3421(+)